MSQLAEWVATGPAIYGKLPGEKLQDVIYVKGIGLLEWVDQSSGDGLSGYRSPAQAQQPGTVDYFARRIAPAGWLKANGAAVLIAAYGDLTQEIYCGDANNATAAWGYRCTDPTAAHTTRNIGGAYLVLPDLRGEFIRGWSDGSTVDAGRLFGSKQADMYASHSHPYIGGSGAVNGVNSSLCLSNRAEFTWVSGSLIQPAGGNETRPRNIALLACIKI